MSEMSIEAELTLTLIKSQFFYPIQRHLMSVLLNMQLQWDFQEGAKHGLFIHFIYLYSN